VVAWEAEGRVVVVKEEEEVWEMVVEEEAVMVVAEWVEVELEEEGWEGEEKV